MEHLTEYLIIATNFLLFLVSLALTIVTGIDNHAMAKIAALAIAKIAPQKVTRIAKKNKIVTGNSYIGKHEKG